MRFEMPRVIPIEGCHRENGSKGTARPPPPPDSRFLAGLSGEISDAYGTECAKSPAQLEVVMAGLDPAIHACAGVADNCVDARVKPAHDDLRLVLPETEQPISVPRTALRVLEIWTGNMLKSVASFSVGL